MLRQYYLRYLRYQHCRANRGYQKALNCQKCRG
jgi:hypothetical protein